MIRRMTKIKKLYLEFDDCKVFLKRMKCLTVSGGVLMFNGVPVSSPEQNDEALRDVHLRSDGVH